MSRYWPCQSSIDLNLAVADIFMQTHQKFSQSIGHENNNSMVTDILDTHSKKQLFQEILIQLETLILDIIELNLSTKQIKQLHNQILYNCIQKSMQMFVQKLKLRNQILINFYSNYNRLFFHEHSAAVHNLLTYLIFGSNAIKNNVFIFCTIRTPFNHIKGLLENIIIQISNCIIFNILESYKLPNAILEVTNNQAYSAKYQSTRDLLNFRNNLITQTLLNFYIYYPQNIYCGKYQILLLSSKGIIQKNIYMNRSSDYLQLSNIQLSSIIYLELQDFIIPKLKSLITLIGTLIIYVFEKITNKSINIYLNQEPKAR